VGGKWIIAQCDPAPRESDAGADADGGVATYDDGGLDVDGATLLPDDAAAWGND
jgi:hypothetical protein